MPEFQGTLVDVHPRFKHDKDGEKSSWLEVKLEGPLGTQLNTELTKLLGEQVMIAIDAKQGTLSISE